MVSFEMPLAADAYPDAAIRTSLATLTARATVPVDEQLTLVPFSSAISPACGWRASCRASPCNSPTANRMQPTRSDRAHLVIGVAAGGPPTAERSRQFAQDRVAARP